MEKFIDWLKANGYQYKDEDIYLEACTHSSYANEHHREMGDNERLEFMGDSVLQIWSATQLFLMEPKMREGQMTTLRAQTVCESTLAVLNRQLGWYEFLRLGVGEEKTTFSEIKNCVRSTLEPFLYKKTHRNPIVIPVILNSKQTMEELQKNRKNNFHARKPRATKAS